MGGGGGLSTPASAASASAVDQQTPTTHELDETPVSSMVREFLESNSFITPCVRFCSLILLCIVSQPLLLHPCFHFQPYFALFTAICSRMFFIFMRVSLSPYFHPFALSAALSTSSSDGRGVACRGRRRSASAPQCGRREGARALRVGFGRIDARTGMNRTCICHRVGVFEILLNRAVSALVDGSDVHHVD